MRNIRFLFASPPSVEELNKYLWSDGWEVMSTRRGQGMSRTCARDNKGAIVKISRIKKFPEELRESDRTHLCPTIFPFGNVRRKDGYMSVLMVQPELDAPNKEQTTHLRLRVSRELDRAAHNIGSLNSTALFYDW